MRSILAASLAASILLGEPGAHAETLDLPFAAPNEEASQPSGAGKTRTKYREAIPRDHGFEETARYIAALYGLSAVGFLLINWDKIQQNASLSHFGKIVVFDNDLPSSNLGVHVLTGSQCYLFYRGRQYDKTEAFLLTALQSGLFEFTIEFIQEEASLEDLIVTPLFGSIVGRGLELASLPLLNSDILPFRILGNLLNLPTLLGLNQNTVEVVPILGKNTGVAVQLRF